MSQNAGERLLSNGVIRLMPSEYAHINSERTGSTFLLSGPQNYTLANDERVSKFPTPFHVVPRGHYCMVRNPHEVDVDGVTPLRDGYGQVKVLMGEKVFRIGPISFPLYPEETIEMTAPLTVLSFCEALVVRVLRTYELEGDSVRTEGQHYLFKGPGTYLPRVEEEVIGRRHAISVAQGCGIKLRALESFVDDTGRFRAKGDVYVRCPSGIYFCAVTEEFIELAEPLVVPPCEALHIEVTCAFVDERAHALGASRYPGQVYMVTHEDAPVFLLHPNEVLRRRVRKVQLNKRQYAVIVNIVSSQRSIITDTSHYLRPDEVIEDPGVREGYVLIEGQALLLKAVGEFDDATVLPQVKRRRGDMWLLKGPCEYVPNSLVEVCKDKDGQEVRQRILLSDGEGIYVRNSATGVVRVITGPTAYMLDVHEELWEKSLPPHVEQCLQQHLPSKSHQLADGVTSSHANGLGWRAQRAVVYKVPHGSVTQLYNYHTLKARIIFGPDRVILEPEEKFTVVRLSHPPVDTASTGKYLSNGARRCNALHLFLGPSNMTDEVRVETRDHAQLALQLTYAWYFDVAPGDEVAAQKCFSVADFMCDACSFIAGRIRAAVASLPFQQFHKNSGRVLRQAVFGVDTATGEPREQLRFEVNNLVVTSVDTYHMEMLDSRTREGLHKSVKIAIETSAQMQESNAQQAALALEQQSAALLAHIKMQDQVKNEAHRKLLMEAESKSLATMSSGRSKSIASSAAVAAVVEQEAQLKSVSTRLEKENLINGVLSEIDRLKQKQELEFQVKQAALERTLKRELAEVENGRHTALVSVIGPETLGEIAKAAPEFQVKVLEALGLKGYLVMDGGNRLVSLHEADEMARQD
ncbi:Major Vault Protein repeat Shoulder domain [Trypanosoma vivax]|uniref:Major vault protein n=1 Tax=Trypanosoma vivax (strain Y486) TaxID=1055687 RepID=G0U6S3_TRYVY|nr:Major Vault Protein repeat Shoulder domain [Trypanosoma vivax]CCC51578.1 conserved hypothetical protein [Trypanosoma vivax Y486]